MRDGNVLYVMYTVMQDIMFLYVFYTLFASAQFLQALPYMVFLDIVDLRAF